MACAAAAALLGCQTTDEDFDARGRPATSDDPVVEGMNRGVNTNYFGPVNSGTEAARGPGTPSGTFDHRR
jgi:hypothetical protein